MFRPMRRKKQQLSEEACVQILRQEPRGVLSMLGDEGYPYGIPLDHWYCPADGKLYFHGAKSGHKLDALRQYDKVSYCVYDQGYRREGEWALNIQSVVVFGRIQEVEDPAFARDICRQIARKFTDDEAYIEQEVARSCPNVQCLCLTPEHISGKLVNEA